MSCETRAPNLLFIMTDQQRFDALSCHNGVARTPNLDALAAQGADLRKHYSQAPVCVPSRCTIFSGRYPHSTNVLENFVRYPSGEDHLFSILKEAGYHLSYFGKNHLLEDDEFRANLNVFETFSEHSDDSQRKAYQELEERSLQRLESIGSYASSEYHDFPDMATTSGLIATSVATAIRVAPHDRPWSITASFYDPHVPHLAPKRFEKEYPPKDIQIPINPNENLKDKAPRVALKQEAQGALRASLQEKRLYSSVYYSMCSYVDELIGDIIEELGKREDAENTIIVFLSDHGDFNWDHGLCKKDLLLYESLLHVPCIISWPGKIPPQVVDKTFTEHADIVPTLLELASIPRPPTIQGKSMVPLLEQQTASHRKSTHAEVCYPDMRNPFSTYPEFIDALNDAKKNGDPLGQSTSFNIPGDYTKSIRTEDWTYIWYGNGYEELYDANNDPKEERNLASEPTEETRLLCQKLRLELFDWFLHTAPVARKSVPSKTRNSSNSWIHP
ncbi:sulfatase family protein [Pelagicoccus mobilis]|uniref:Sulfatase-like hydrolase/transferase n=1 Tax=Pelagicoccus mobilis TaxID=415221 RepID=A0A934RY69_9BACT|nr:sulfatase-like hydrolase/transferase [Pelagicoccus mobilis]MBK1878518.1 sulfatase-like hydrolase/transferase [Pelagicoccus mobilis]